MNRSLAFEIAPKTIAPFVEKTGHQISPLTVEEDSTEDRNPAPPKSAEISPMKKKLDAMICTTELLDYYLSGITF